MRTFSSTTQCCSTVSTVMTCTSALRTVVVATASTQLLTNHAPHPHLDCSPEPVDHNLNPEENLVLPTPNDCEEPNLPGLAL